MSYIEIDFPVLASDLLNQAYTLIPSWLPAGKSAGVEWKCGSIEGEAGTSLSINMKTGKWADFSTGDKGGDLISLYAAMKHIKNIDAAKILINEGFSGRVEKISSTTKLTKTTIPNKTAPLINYMVPPSDDLPDFIHHKYGKPSSIYNYKNLEGETISYVCRYDITIDGKKKKHFTPFNFTDKGWIKKQRTENRPLFNLHKIQRDKPILICEGEKATQAAEKICGDTYTCVSWIGGGNAINLTDWSPILDKNFKVLIWPDDDSAGRSTTDKIVEIVSGHSQNLKVIQTTKETKQDAHDYLARGMDWSKFRDWAVPLVYEIMPEAEVVEAELVSDIPFPVDDIPFPTDMDMTGGQFIQNNVIMNSESNETLENMSKHKTEWLSIGLTLTKQGHPVINTGSILTIFDRCKELKGKFFYDTFFAKPYTSFGSAGNNFRPVKDSDHVNITGMLNNKYGLNKVTCRLISEAMTAVFSNNERSTPKIWLESLEWDQVERIEGFFHTHYGTEKSPYSDRVGINFWLSMVARVMRPGCKADNMVVLEGMQGCGKSRSVEAIVGKESGLSTTSNYSMGSVDFIKGIRGFMLVEIGELSGMRKSDVETIKTILSTRVDNIRESYGKYHNDIPRQGIFIGTTNEKAYLNDPTGARRFWPIKTTKIDINGIDRDREQLFAEAVFKYKAGELWHIHPPMAEEMQSLRTEQDVWLPIIYDFLKNKEYEMFTTSQILDDAIKLTTDRQDKRHSNRIAVILRKIGWDFRRKRKSDGSLGQVWFCEKGQNEFDLDGEENRTSSIENDGVQSAKDSVQNYADLVCQDLTPTVDQ